MITDEIFTTYGIPHHMREGVNQYIEHGVCGSFLQAVMENNLVEAAGRADNINVRCLREWAIFLYNEMPNGTWGSREKVAAHIKACAKKRIVEKQ